MIIAFCGPDGSGKTTHARLIYYTLASKGVRVKYIKFKAHHLTVYVILRILQAFKVIPQTSCPAELDYNIALKFSKARKLLLLLEHISAIIWLLLNVKLPQKYGYVIVAERYIPDFIVTLEFITMKNDQRSVILKLLRPFIEDAKIICLYAEPKLLVKRKTYEKIPLSYAKYLVSRYKAIAKEFSIALIDTTSRNIYEVHKAIVNLVLS